MSKSRSFRFAILIVFGATLIMASSLQIDMPLAEIWKQTGLTVKALDQVLTDKNCRQNQRATIGCVRALDALLPDGLKLKPRYLVDDENLIVRNFGQVAIAKELPVKLGSPDEMLREIKSNSQKEREEWIKLLRQQKFSFENLLAAIEPLARESTQEAEKTARAYNSFLEYFYDPHSYVIPAAFVRKESEKDGENFTGIGIQVARLGRYPLVQSVYNGGPAERAGLKRNDVILQIDGATTTGLTFEEMLKKLKGQEGSPVELTLWRDAEEVKVTLKREALSRTNLISRVIEHDSKKILYLRIASFMKQKLCAEITWEITMAPEDTAGIVLDLRDNGGGLLDSAVCVVSAFLPPGKAVVTVKNFDGSSDPLVTRGAKLTDLPMTVLINSDSASASEIVAGSLQDHGRAWIVGERSWGKGSVQQSEYWALNDKILLFRTVARFYLPSGRSIQLFGIKPDVMVGDNRLRLREADLDGSVLPAEGRPRQRSFPPALKSCLDQKRALLSDDQLGVAEGLLACAVGT